MGHAVAAQERERKRAREAKGERRGTVGVGDSGGVANVRLARGAESWAE